MTDTAHVHLWHHRHTPTTTCTKPVHVCAPAEATAAAEQRLFKGRIALEDRYHDLAWCNKDDDCATKAEGIRLAVEDFEEAMGLTPFTHPEPSRGSALREHRRAVVHAEALLASASPRQGEPVAVNIRRKPIPASVVRLMRIEQRPAGRGTIIVHEIDEVHPNTEACDICQLVTGAALSEPAES